jgi:integrase
MNKKELLERLEAFKTDLRFDELSKKTINKYMADCKRFIKFVKHDDNITKYDTLDYKDYMMSIYKPKTVNSYIISLDKFLKYVELPDLALKQLKLQEKDSLDNVIDENDYKRMKRFALKLGDEELYWIMRTIVNTGIRISERKWITVESLQDDFYIPIRSKGKNRAIIFPQQFRRDLLKYCKKNDITSGQIFTYTDIQIWRRLQKTAGAARVNLKKAHAHSFRHYFAKRFVNAKYSDRPDPNELYDLSDILGHSKMETTRIYARSTREEKRKKMERI